MALLLDRHASKITPPSTKSMYIFRRCTRAPAIRAFLLSRGRVERTRTLGSQNIEFLCDESQFQKVISTSKSSVGIVRIRVSFRY